jgi:hypothetical protein
MPQRYRNDTYLQAGMALSLAPITGLAQTIPQASLGCLASEPAHVFTGNVAKTKMGYGNACKI